MVYPMQQYGRMPISVPMQRNMPPRMPFPYGNMGYGNYGYGGQNRNNGFNPMLFIQMMRNGNNAGSSSYAPGHQDLQQMPQQYVYNASYGGGGGHHHRSGGYHRSSGHRGGIPRGYGMQYPSYRGASKRYPSAKKVVDPKKVAKKKVSGDTEKDIVTGYTGNMNAQTCPLPTATEGKMFLDMNKISLNEQQFRNFIAENAIRVVKRYIAEAYGDEDGYLLLDGDGDETNDDMVTPQDNKDIYTIDVFNIDADEGIDDMRYAAAYESFDEALEAARECARSYADCGDVVCVGIMSGEYETPSGNIFGDPEVIYTISNSDEETTMNARKEAGFTTAEVDEYTE